MSRDEYKGKDIDDLRKMCKKRRIEDVDQTIEFEALVRLHTTVSCFGCSHQIHRSIVYAMLAPNLHHYVCTIDGVRRFHDNRDTTPDHRQLYGSMNPVS
jgi:hypothetical protein